MNRTTTLAGPAALVLTLVIGAVQMARAAPEAMTDRIVVKYRSAPAQAQAQAAASARSDGGKPFLLANTAAATHVKTMASGASVFRLTTAMSLRAAHELAAKMAANPAVAYAAPDVWVRPSALPTDPYAYMQWPLLAPKAKAGGANFEAAWPYAGTRKVTVAVVDTGAVNHLEVTANEVPGYDFVTDVAAAGDDTARDADPTDEGDYCASSATTSSWHGLKVAGLIAAVANNGVGVAGAAWNNARLLHARALGRCGGYLSDVADAVAWAAGAPLEGAPSNAHPASVVNLSLGAPAGTLCYAYMQEAVDAALTRGAVVVVAAGNEGVAKVGAPANCSGVISVGAHTASGDLADYSNHSPEVTLTAPGGGQCLQMPVCDTAPTVALGNTGMTALGGNQDGTYFMGTSAAAPHVAAAAALLLAANPLLTPAQVKSVLVSTARAHPEGAFCQSAANACGAGMLDVLAAMQQTAAPGVTISRPATAVAGSTLVSLSATTDGPGAAYAYQWTQKAGAPVRLDDAATATVRFTAPAVKGDDLVFTLQVSSATTPTVSQDVVVRVNNAPTFTLPTTVTATEGTPLNLVLDGRDADGDVVTFTATGRAELRTTGGVLEWAEPHRTDLAKERETFTLTVAAHDGAQDGSGDTVKTIDVTVVKAAPVGGGPNDVGGTPGGGALGVPAVLGLALAVAALAALRRRA